MIRQMVRRGPDDEGFWSDRKHCQLGFRRLSILDLSPAGHQPMLTPDGRYSLVYNGEVYNFADLRKQFVGSGHTFAPPAIRKSSCIFWQRKGGKAFAA